MNQKIQALAAQVKKIAIENNISYDEALKTISSFHQNRTEQRYGRMMSGINSVVQSINESPVISEFLTKKEAPFNEFKFDSPDMEFGNLEGKTVFVYPSNELLKQYASSFENRKYAVAVVTEDKSTSEFKAISATLFLPDGVMIAIRDVQSGIPTGERTVYAFTNQLRLEAPTT